MERDFLLGSMLKGQEATVLNWKKVGLDWTQEEIFYEEGGEKLGRVAQKSCGCPVMGSVQGQVGWGFEQIDLVEDVPVHGRGVGLGVPYRLLLTQTILWFYVSMILWIT